MRLYDDFKLRDAGLPISIIRNIQIRLHVAVVVCDQQEEEFKVYIAGCF
jgi:hypothetical protein